MCAGRNPSRQTDRITCFRHSVKKQVLAPNPVTVYLQSTLLALTLPLPSIPTKLFDSLGEHMAACPLLELAHIAFVSKSPLANLSIKEFDFAEIAALKMDMARRLVVARTCWRNKHTNISCSHKFRCLWVTRVVCSSRYLQTCRNHWVRACKVQLSPCLPLYCTRL